VLSSTAISTAAASAQICNSLRRRGVTDSRIAKPSAPASTTRRRGVMPPYRPQIENGDGRSAW
jgi:hypothetical protein